LILRFPLTKFLAGEETAPARDCMRILTSDEVSDAVQEATSRSQVSVAMLIHRSGYAVAQFCASHFKFNSACVVCGRGQNGAEGLAAAEALRRVVADVIVIILARDASELGLKTGEMYSQLTSEPIWIGDEAAFETPALRDALAADLIVDAIAGSGDALPLPALESKAIEIINDAFATVVSVDLPSGVEADSMAPVLEKNKNVVFAQGIITFVAPKPAHVFGKLTSGPIAVSEIGVQPALVGNKTGLEVVTGQEVGIAFPPRADDAHKGQFGHVLVIAGSRGKAGAAGLAGMAALRAGAGLVTVACPLSIQATVAGFAPELITEELPGTEQGAVALSAMQKVQALMRGKDLVVLGPGLSTVAQTAEFVRGFVARCPLPLVLDADGLNAFAGHYTDLRPRGESAPFRVLTPHPGEAARLTGCSVGEVQAARLETAQRISRETGSCVVLKGWRTVVAGASGEAWINMSGNPAMAKGGSGDVLSGIVAAALVRQAAETQGPLGKEAELLNDLRVAAAVHLHGIAGDITRDALHEHSVIATDVLDNLAEAFQECEQQVDRGLFYLRK
jgi:ADP-dependent NAD(P)H-hydrate dehydratase / NAD(P)H-hydrate epimerase